MDEWPQIESFRELHGITGECHYIYGLFDPRTGELRYVGKSDRPRRRLADQIRERADTHRCHWVQELCALGLKPEQCIIDAVPVGDDWQAVEMAYIRGAQLAGHALTNGTAGGDGVRDLSPESRARIRAAWQGRKHAPESLAKIGAASRGRRHTPEHRQKMRDLMAAREFTTEHRRRIRRATEKLTSTQVSEIRALIAQRIPQREIAARFGIHQGSVSNIARGKTYTDTPNAGEDA